jgi:drug/metabolite transporter (DMT)-like permease
MLMPLLGLLWGSSYLWIAILAGSFAPMMVILLRTVAALAIIGTLAIVGRRKLPPFGRVWLHLAIITVAADLVPFFMLIWAQQTVASSVAAVLNSTIPLFTLLIAALVFRSETITRERMVGIVLGIIGVVALSGTATSGGELLSPGVVAVTVSSIFYGFGFVYARRYVRGDPFAIVALQMMMTIVVLLPLTLASGSFSVSGISTREILAILGLGTMSSGLAYAIYYQALERLGPTMTSYATYLSPVVALIIGWVVLGERISLLGYVGILIVAAGVLTASGLTRTGVHWLKSLRIAPAILDEAPAEIT